MGSASDLGVMRSAADTLEAFGVPYEMTVVSAHRTPQKMLDFARGARNRGIRILIAGAGGAAHVAGMLAALTTLPVIGVPVDSKLSGLDSLLSTVQMPEGVPVATVAINGAGNAALLACRILGVASAEMTQKLIRHQAGLRSKVEEKARELEKA